MIKILATALKSPQVLLPLVLFVIGGLIISSAWNLYGQQAQRKPPNAEVQPKTNGGPTAQEIRSKITQSSSQEDENLEIISEKNLFTSDRQAWQAPKKEDSGQDGDQEKNDSKKQADQRSRQIPKSKIRLYGTTMTGSNNMALIYMEPFESKRKYYTAHEGDVLRDEGDRGEWLYFKVLSVDAESVTLEDPEGESFQVGLFDHQREQKKTSSRDTSGIHIAVGGEEEGQKAAGSQAGGEEEKEKTAPDEQSDQESEETGSASDQDNQESEDAEDTPSGEESPEGSEEEKGPESLVDALKKLGNQREGGDQRNEDQEERERQVEEGNMRKIETPFGTIYRPAE
ncbi:MAG: hypothetical protein ACOCTJ_02230 [Desulfobia sp.]